MESQEERIQAEIAKNKEKEAKEEMNRKMKALELQKKENSKKGASTNFGSGYGSQSNYSYQPESTYGSSQAIPSSNSYNKAIPYFSS